MLNQLKKNKKNPFMFALKPDLFFTGWISFSENLANRKNTEVWV